MNPRKCLESTIRCVNHFASNPTHSINLAGAVGIESTPKVLETFVLTLDYRPIMAVRTGLESTTSCVTGRHSDQLNLPDHLWYCGGGFEPSTFGSGPTSYQTVSTASLYSNRMMGSSNEEVVTKIKNGGGRGIRTRGLTSPVGFQSSGIPFSQTWAFLQIR